MSILNDVVFYCSHKVHLMCPSSRQFYLQHCHLVAKRRMTAVNGCMEGLSSLIGVISNRCLAVLPINNVIVFMYNVYVYV